MASELRSWDLGKSGKGGMMWPVVDWGGHDGVGLGGEGHADSERLLEMLRLLSMTG